MMFNRYLIGYHPVTDEMVVELKLPETVTLEVLQSLFGGDPDDPMVIACYRITPKDFAVLRENGVSVSDDYLEYFLQTFG